LGKQAVGLLKGMGYTNLRYYVGGMAEWVENGGAVEKLETPAIAEIPKRDAQRSSPRGVSWLNWLDILSNWSLEQLVGFWLGIIIVFGFIYWAAGIGMGWGLQAGNTAVKSDLHGLGTAIYFSFVTALSIGYGDIIPVGALRILAITEGIAGLLIFGCVISKLVSRRQEQLVEEIHRTTFEDRLDRVRTNLHLVFADLEDIGQINRQHSALPDQVLRRFESSERVFIGELKTIHDLLYRSQLLPEEEALESLLANLALCLESLVELLGSQPKRSGTLDAGLREVSNLASEICGECVPRDYAPAMKQWMDQIQELAHKIA
jgi:potassium channel LctB